jgi:hypothetical protein
VEGLIFTRNYLKKRERPILSSFLQERDPFLKSMHFSLPKIILAGLVAKIGKKSNFIPLAIL